MSVIIQPATAAHVPDVARVKRAVWPQETHDEARIASAIADVHHRTHVACDDAQVVGFVDGFVTSTASGLQRWEVDLLAVHPSFHGQKIGQQLIATTTQQARAQKAALARALIQIDNVASQRAFERNGFHSDGLVYRLMVTIAGQTLDDRHPQHAHLVPVNTMNYRGLWLEGELSATVLAAARTACARRSADLAGVLIPAESDGLVAAAIRLGYIHIDQFQWWLNPLH